MENKIKGFLSLSDSRWWTSTGEKSKNRDKPRTWEYCASLVWFSLKSTIFLKCFMFSSSFQRQVNSMHSSDIFLQTFIIWSVFIFSWLYWLYKFILIDYFFVKALFIWLNFYDDDDDVFSFCWCFSIQQQMILVSRSSIYLTRTLIVNFLRFQVCCNFLFRCFILILETNFHIEM